MVKLNSEKRKNVRFTKKKSLVGLTPVYCKYVQIENTQACAFPPAFFLVVLQIFKKINFYIQADIVQNSGSLSGCLRILDLISINWYFK